MKQKKLSIDLNYYLMAGAVCLIGLVLLLHPDLGSKVIGLVLSWGILLAGAGTLLYALFARPFRYVPSLILGAVGLAIGIYYVCNPLAMANTLYRFLGIYLACQGGHLLYEADQRKKLGMGYVWQQTQGIVLLVLAAILILFPGTMSRIFMALLGLVILCCGAARIVSGIRDEKRQGSPYGYIIDADE